MAKIKPKSKRLLAKRGSYSYTDTGSMRSVKASVDLWRNKGGPKSHDPVKTAAFTAHLCVGRGRTKGAPKYCGMARGKNPREALANAARDLARVMESRSGAFAGLGKRRK